MDASAYREEIYDTFAGASEFDERVRHALDVGTEYLGASVGFLTHIEDGTQRVTHVAGDHEEVHPDASCPLEDAYCRRTVEMDGSLAVQDATASEAVSRSAVDTFGFGTYIGAKVVVDDETYGTVCFADGPERERPFSESEELFVELLARLVGQTFERRQRNERLEREKRRFEGIAETSFDILFRVSLDGTFTYVSSAVERVLGYEPDELVGEPFAAFVADDEVEGALAEFDRTLNGEPLEGVELDFRHADGGTVTIEVNVTPIEEDDGVTGIQGVGRDVTARKERERELTLKNRAMDEADIGITLADSDRPDDPLVYVNDGFEQITGYAAEEACGRNCRFLQGPATDDSTVDTLRGAIDAEEPVAVDIVNYRKDGTPFWNHLRLTPIEDEDGTVGQYLGFQDDVTERKRSEQLVALLNRVLRHNLRNDMNAILGFSDLIEDADPEEAAAFARRIETSAAALVALSEKVHELERYADRERDPQRLDPAVVLERATERNRELSPEATVETRVETDRDVCAGPELERALAELVENALKHGGDCPHVEVIVRDEGEAVELVIRDDGDGINDTEAAVIAHGTETALEHGSGVGLWLVNWVVTRYGGSFQIRADPGGTVATVRLPAIGPDESVADATRRPTVLFR